MTTSSTDTSIPAARADHANGLPMGRRAGSARPATGFRREPASAEPAIGTLITDGSESHLLTVAPTGAGKGVSVAIPWLLSHRGSAVVIDPKGEAASITARHRKQLGHRVCIVDPFDIVRLPAGIGERCKFNVLEAILAGSEELSDDCASAAELVAGEAPLSSQDPFWRQSALDLMSTLMGWAWVRAKVTGVTNPEDGTLSAVWALLHDDDMAMALANVLDQFGKHADMPAFVRRGLANFLQHEADKVRTSVRTEAVALMRNFGSGRIQAVSSATTLPLEQLRDGGAITLYLVLPPDRLESHSQWLRVTLGALLTLMVRRRTRPQVPTLFLIDELGHLGPLPQLKQAITLLRGYGVRVALFLQSLAQLKSLWPKDHETILENCGVWLNFGNTTQAAAKAMADQLGDVSAETLFQMGADSLAVHRAGKPTEIARRLDYRTDPLLRGRFDANPYFAAPSAVDAAASMP